MPLTDSAIRTAKPAEKPVRMFDGGGLYLEVSPAGGKLWRLKYRFEGKEKRLSFGSYPDVPLKAARERRDEARKVLAAGIDPGEQRKAMKAASEERALNSFEVICREWLEKWRTTVEPAQYQKALARHEKNVFPWLGGRPIAEISAPEVLAVLRRVDERGARYTAHKIRSEISQAFRYAVATGRAERDPCPDLRGAIPPARGEHFAAITTPKETGELLRAIDAFRGTLIVKSALLLAPMLFVRPGELRKAEWSEFDFERGEWNIPAKRMKARRPHLVPLPPQAVQILRDLEPLTGRFVHVFAGRDPKKPMSDAAVNAALRRMGYDTKTEITGHGFRAMARTILHEELHFEPDVIEHQLAHSVPDALGAAYNRTKFLKERREMMRRWADYLGRLKTGAAIVSLREQKTLRS